MFGIAGVSLWRGGPEEELSRRWGALLGHRGPDGEGFYAHRNTALVYRRLSILDLEGGAQPIATDDGRSDIVVNGEIYNYRVLAMALYAREGYRELYRLLVEGLRSVDPSLPGNVPQKSAFSNARQRVGSLPLRRLFEETAVPMALPSTLARPLLGRLPPGMLCLCDRYFYGFDLWEEARETGADLLWRIKKNSVFRADETFADGSYLSRASPSNREQEKGHPGLPVRII